MAKDDHVYMFLHIPKTGGSTLRRHLKSNIRPAKLFCAYNRAHHQLGADYFSDRGVVERWNSSKVIAGHYVNKNLSKHLEGRRIRYTTVLREPVSRLVSQYNWSFRAAEGGSGSLPQPLEKWIERPGRWNMQAKAIAKTFLGMPWSAVKFIPDDELWDIASKALNEFWLVGDLENLETSMAPLFKALGVPGKITQKQKVAGVHYAKRLEKTPEVAEFVASRCQVDQRLYNQFSCPNS